MPSTVLPKPRLRDWGIQIGHLPTGPLNALVDVAGLRVGHSRIVHDEPRIARTGVTVILPDAIPTGEHLFAGHHRFNGNGEMTGLSWVEESGLLTTPIAITNTHQVGLVRDTLVAWMVEHGSPDWVLPVVAETYDGVLNDIVAFHVREEHVRAALNSANDSVVPEGNVGGGTGMICHQYKGGIGTSSRVVQVGSSTYTLGVLVQANYGIQSGLRLNGLPVGRLLQQGTGSEQSAIGGREGSIIVVLATDAPLLPHQCNRLAHRAGVGLARTGGCGYDSSGDLFFAFSTANRIQQRIGEINPVQMIANTEMNQLFDATAEAVEESIWNALCAAETMTGFKATVEAIPMERVAKLYHPHQQALVGLLN